MHHAINFSMGTAKALASHSIMGDVLVSTASSFKPLGQLLVEHSVKGAAASLGNKLEVSATQEDPSLLFISTEDNVVEKGDLVTAVMTDPDAPSRTDKKASEYCHYVEANMPLATDDGISFTPLRGNKLVEYMGPAPPQGTGPHRYVWLLFKQPNKKRIVENNVEQLRKRANWGYTDATPPVGVDRWAGEKGLELLGVNFYYAENK